MNVEINTRKIKARRVELDIKQKSNVRYTQMLHCYLFKKGTEHC